MPQMAPLWWETLFFMFIALFFMTSIIIYHLPKVSKTEMKSSENMINQMNWKW